jgi:hypothetical protein
MSESEHLRGKYTESIASSAFHTTVAVQSLVRRRTEDAL